MMSKRTHILVVFLLVFFISRAQDSIVPLYKNKIPYSIPNNVKEEPEIQDGKTVRVRLVNEPELYIFKPSGDSQKAQGAVLILPGGGYGHLAIGHEGFDIAQWLSSMGLTGVVLKYRLPDDRLMSNRSIVPLTDAQHAMEYLRENALRLHIDPDKIGVMGFSAGGHLASTLSTHCNENERPNFSVLIYPVISMETGLTHMGSRANLIGKNPSEEMIKMFSNEQQITAKTPPAFLVHASDDKAVPYENSIVYYENLVDAGVKNAELHIFPEGGHGYGMAVKSGLTVSIWPELLKAWLVRYGWLDTN
ncbi:MAG: alpha/beta hydrolase [Flavobacteriaceae bacterium]|nr:alpha/beta hydrolase [Flavobacteriaceae bacterium]